MALRKYNDFINMNQDTLVSDLKEAENNYQRLRFEHTVKGLQNPQTLRQLRREIAMMKTELTKRTLNQA